MRALLIVLFITFFNTFSAQSLHHEMISAQGGGVVTASGMKVNYTVGQQSVIGTNSNQYVVQQGFQQNNWSKIIKQNNNLIVTTLYPNPFVDQITFSFSGSPGAKVKAIVFDLLGRLIHSETVNNVNNEIKLNLSRLSSAEYLIRLTSENYEYSAKIIKE
jgi:hypothetical protein